MTRPSILAVAAAAMLACSADNASAPPAATFVSESASGDTGTGTGPTGGSQDDDDDDGPLSDSDTTGSVDTDGATTQASEGSTSGGPTTCESSLQDSTCDAPGAWMDAGQCNPYVPTSCGAEAKCGPLSFDAKGNPLPATSCGSLADRPDTLGQSCEIVWTPNVWTDSCDVGLHCEAFDNAKTGTCVELCGCGPGDRTCPDGYLCQSDDSFPGLNVCRRGCDPLAPDCGGGDGCYPIAVGGGRYEWMCYAAGTLPAGSECPGYDCDATTVCSQGSCWEPCDLDDPAACPGQCMPYTRPPEDEMPLDLATACFDNVGICVI